MDYIINYMEGLKMRYLKKKGSTNSIRKVVSDVGNIMYGIVGTVGDLLDAGILEYCDASRDSWCMVSSVWLGAAWFGSDRQDCVDYAMLYINSELE